MAKALKPIRLWCLAGTNLTAVVGWSRVHVKQQALEGRRAGTTWADLEKSGYRVVRVTVSPVISPKDPSP